MFAKHFMMQSHGMRNFLTFAAYSLKIKHIASRLPVFFKGNNHQKHS
jgi:hypothetical protein